jgi:hypothetical protein
MPEKFRVPDSILSELNEYSGGGFILFIYDNEGRPKPYATFDDPARGLGMQKYIQNWLAVVDNLNLENSMEQIYQEQPNTEEPE